MLSVNFQAAFECIADAVTRQESHDITCSFVGGFAFGDALGVGLRSSDGWWKVEGLEVDEHLTEVSLFSF